jgi:hypothetical protein
VKTKNTPWTPEEEALLAEAARDRVSPARLSVRLKRSEGSIKRRMRELGLVGTKRAPRRAAVSEMHFKFDPVLQAQLWLEACQAGDLRSVMHFYDCAATLECACTGPAVYAGASAIREYWGPKIRSMHPLRFSLENTWLKADQVVVDYLSFEGKPVRMFLAFDNAGKISRSECGPRSCTKLAASETSH